MRARCGERDGHGRLWSLPAAPIIEQHIEPFSLPEIAFADVNDFFFPLMAHFPVKLRRCRDVGKERHSEVFGRGVN